MLANFFLVSFEAKLVKETNKFAGNEPSKKVRDEGDGQVLVFSFETVEKTQGLLLEIMSEAGKLLVIVKAFCESQN